MHTQVYVKNIGISKLYNNFKFIWYWEAAKKSFFSGQSTKAFSPPPSLSLVVKRKALTLGGGNLFP